MTGLGMLQSFMGIDHAVPPGASVVEQKYCENCSATFTRPRPPFRRFVVKNDDHFLSGIKTAKSRGNLIRFAGSEEDQSVIYVDTGQRYCQRCRRNALQPVNDLTYREQLPREAEMRHAHHLPKYDESIVKFRQSAKPVPPKRRRYTQHGNWLNKLLVENEKRPLSYKQMTEVTEMAAMSIANCLRRLGFSLKPVGHVFPRRSCMGPPAQIYNIEAIISTIL